jgi:hypothetical protein
MTEARSDVVIRTPDQRLRVLVSSTLGELADERQAVSGAISTLRLTPVMFELGARPRFAALAFAEGNHERAALLEGAAEGLRQRAGVRAWPVLRRPETELAEEVREALGADRFDQVFARGSHLSSRTRWLPSATGQAPVRGRPELWPCPARRCQGASPIRRRTGSSVRAASGSLDRRVETPQRAKPEALSASKQGAASPCFRHPRRRDRFGHEAVVRKGTPLGRSPPTPSGALSATATARRCSRRRSGARAVAEAGS